MGRPSIRHANKIYLTTLLLVLLSTPIIQRLDFYHSVLLAEGLLLLPTVIYAYGARMNLRQLLRIQWPGWQLLALSSLAAVFCYVIATCITASTWMIFARLGSAPPMLLPPIDTPQELGVTILVGGLLASVAEEIFFRGYLLRAYEKLGSLPAVILVGLLFGIFHLSLHSLVSTAFLGIIMGYLVFRTDSVLAGIVAHFTNNLLAFLIIYFSRTAANVQPGPFDILPLGLLAFISLFFLSRILIKVERHTFPLEVTAHSHVRGDLWLLVDSWPLLLSFLIFITLAYGELLLVFRP
jgi:membrane protease YdiL (CAAX protease family)